MNAQQILTLSISTIALILSIVSIVFQYQVKIDLRYRINQVSFASLEKKVDEPRTAAMVVSISFYNLGNRPSAIESVSMSVTLGKVEDLKKAPPKTCESGGQFLIPISKASYSQLSIEPFVIKKEDVEVRELVFDMFHFDKGSEVSMEGVACLHFQGSDVSGNSSSVGVPVAIFAVTIDRNRNTLSVEFDTKPYDDDIAKLKVLLGES